MYFIGKDEFQVKLINVGQRNSLENVISMTDYLYLIDSLKNDGMYVLYALVRLLAATGLRISEALQVRYDHLQLGYIDLFLTKGNKYRRVWFPEKVAAEIVELMSDEKIANQFPNGRRGALFEPNNTGRDTAIRYYQNKLYRCGDRYHINKAVLHPHSFRHFFAKNFLLHNQDVSLLADLLGHSKIETTRIYLRQTKEEQRETVNRIVNW